MTSLSTINWFHKIHGANVHEYNIFVLCCMSGSGMIPFETGDNLVGHMITQGHMTKQKPPYKQRVEWILD